MNLLDKKVFEKNFSLFDKDSIIEIVEIFNKEYEKKKEELNEDMADKEYERMKFHLHSLKGMVSNFDTSTLYDIIKEAEIAAINKNEIIYQLIPDLLKKTELLIEDLEEVVRNL